MNTLLAFAAGAAAEGALMAGYHIWRTGKLRAQLAVHEKFSRLSAKELEAILETRRVRSSQEIPEVPYGTEVMIGPLPPAIVSPPKTEIEAKMGWRVQPAPTAKEVVLAKQASRAKPREDSGPGIGTVLAIASVFSAPDPSPSSNTDYYGSSHDSGPPTDFGGGSSGGGGSDSSY